MFSGPLVLEKIASERWRIYKGFEFHSRTGLVVVVPEGFETDLASIPPIVQGLIPKCNYYDSAAVCHDLLYANHRHGIDTTVTRLQADNILLEGCRISAADFNVPDSQRLDWLIYGGVRVGGLDSWETPAEKAARLDSFDLENDL